MSELSNRKDQHLELCLDRAVDAPGTRALFDEVRLVHDALPELALADVQLETRLLGRALRAPLVVVGMTGGTERARDINRDLARAAEARQVAFGVGSQRAMHVDPKLTRTYEVRDVAPDVLLFGNIGAQQIAEVGVDGVARLVDRLGADAIFVHLNPAQELVQPGGDRDFQGCVDAIARLVDRLGPKVWVKETGCGLSRRVARRLVGLGVGGLDVSGAGGTSWTKVESLRADGAQRGLGEELADWGIPTAAAVAATSDLGVPVVASGGVRSGVEVAKALLLGATLGGMARPYLVAQAEGGAEKVEETIASVELALRSTMLLTGSRSAAELRTKPRVLTGELPRWIDALRSEP